ncbi:MAG: CRISPR-associated endonuclease Cas1 [Candidatus Tectomicrobia bacterium]|nr:CRISPR-associated endonuclease Cas1 [Candidatus Tectomicrobia bacterium]
MVSESLQQSELSLEAPPLSEGEPLLPARMVNEYVYCPRLAYLEWVQGEWEASADTVAGAYAHRRVDRQDRPLPPAEELHAKTQLHTRSVTLSSPRLGLIAKIDLVESDGDTVVPIDYKRGKRPHVPAGAFESERVQLCIQWLLLEENGYRCVEGVLYYTDGRERVRVVFDDELRAATRRSAVGLLLVAASGRIPLPLQDSPKCPRCSLVSICLPDEVSYFHRTGVTPRPISVRRDEALPLYVQSNNARLTKKGETITIREEDGPTTTARLLNVSQLVLMGNVGMTTPCLHELMRREIPVTWHRYGGCFLGHTVGVGHKNVELRQAQYRASFAPSVSLDIARSLVAAKVRNSRTMVRRNWRGEEAARQPVLNSLRRIAEQAGSASTPQSLLGLEGEAAALYFRAFPQLLKPSDADNSDGASALPVFRFERRNRRPPTDPINALLSFAYAMLTRTFAVTLSSIGFDAYLGFYHRPRYGRPALALDLMEPFRPIIADSTVLQAINNGEVRPGDFLHGGAGTALKPAGRKRFIAAFERRLAQETTHPIFGYRLTIRRLIEIQGRLFGRFLMGEIKDYPHYRPR